MRDISASSQNFVTGSYQATVITTYNKLCTLILQVITTYNKLSHRLEWTSACINLPVQDLLLDETLINGNTLYTVGSVLLPHELTIHSWCMECLSFKVWLLSLATQSVVDSRSCTYSIGFFSSLNLPSSTMTPR